MFDTDQLERCSSDRVQTELAEQRAECLNDLGHCWEEGKRKKNKEKSKAAGGKDCLQILFFE